MNYPGKLNANLPLSAAALIELSSLQGPE